jgi:hypothetical protein
MRRVLIVEARKRFPDSVDALITFAQRKLDEYNNRVNRSINQQGAHYLTSAGNYAYSIGSGEGKGGMLPRLYYFTDTPTNGVNGTEAGEAENGSFGIVADTWTPYINRGSKASPTWSAYTADDLINYIHDPTVLKDWAIMETAKLCLMDGAMRNRITGEYRDWKDFSDELHREIKTEMPNALAELKFDISNDGLLSDYENKSIRKKGYWA